MNVWERSSLFMVSHDDARSWTDQRERLALVAAIDAEIGVECEDRGVGPEFGHVDEAGADKEIMRMG